MQIQFNLTLQRNLIGLHQYFYKFSLTKSVFYTLLHLYFYQFSLTPSVFYSLQINLPSCGTNHTYLSYSSALYFHIHVWGGGRGRGRGRRTMRKNIVWMHCANHLTNNFLRTSYSIYARPVQCFRYWSLYGYTL